jgi:hypothetical protein
VTALTDALARTGGTHGPGLLGLVDSDARAVRHTAAGAAES